MVYAAKKVRTRRALRWLAVPVAQPISGCFPEIPRDQQTRVYPYPLGAGAGSARPNPKMGAAEPENPLFLGFSVIRGGLRPWSQIMVSEEARPWGGVDPETVKRGVPFFSARKTKVGFHETLVTVPF